jgi:hypothetical protein
MRWRDGEEYAEESAERACGSSRSVGDGTASMSPNDASTWAIRRTEVVTRGRGHQSHRDAVDGRQWGCYVVVRGGQLNCRRRRRGSGGGGGRLFEELTEPVDPRRQRGREAGELISNPVKLGQDQLEIEIHGAWRSIAIGIGW